MIIFIIKLVLEIKIDISNSNLLNDYKAMWRNGYAEDCKSLYPGSIPGIASKKNLVLVLKKSKLRFLYSSVAQLVEQLTVNQLVAGSSPARGAKNNS